MQPMLKTNSSKLKTERHELEAQSSKLNASCLNEQRQAKSSKAMA